MAGRLHDGLLQVRPARALGPPSEKPADPAAAPKKAPKTRPKLTPELLLSDDGLGYILRHFPKAFKYHGRGHEVSDLGNIIGLYTQWHSHLLPYYSFDQFVQKVEQVGATRRVRRCISELRERVARGGDPTKLHEPPVEEVAPDCEQGLDQNVSVPEPPLESHGADENHEMQEEMFDEIYQKATEEQNEVQHTKAASEANPVQKSNGETQKQSQGSTSQGPSRIPLTEEQKARIEANRQKALERAAARARSSQTS
ncbi:uncharacterized protein A4U43_UnF3580 [Asparagus officinalis]|uniref:Chromosome segregation in meiosis protein 3 domain-containing protein n=1 Tax=Asparagus officinalis TaxID=4686 RepID=A0A1R3L717_ASPOF|nr:uncharacterized protein A4U43_UnF3580 [Asparagus officinalis]